MSVAHDPWTNEAGWAAEWPAIPKNLISSKPFWPRARFTIFALGAILAGAVLAFVT